MLNTKRPSIFRTNLAYFAIFMALIYLYNYLGKVKVILSINLNFRKNNDEYEN